MRAEKVVSFLLNDAHGVTSVVGNKVFGLFSRQNTASPLVIYAKQSGDRDKYKHLNDDEEQAVEALVDVLVVATNYEQLKELAEAVRIAIEHKHGTIADVVVIETDTFSEGPDDGPNDQGDVWQEWTFRIVYMEP